MTVGMDDTLNWFKQQTGAKRIEIICRLLGTCIPLELRFFESFIHEKCKPHYNSLRESEIKANAFQELDTICKCDLLYERLEGFEEPLEVNGTANTTVGSTNTTSCANADTGGNGGSGATSPGSSTGTSSTVSTSTGPGCMSPNQLPSRSRMIISLCLMQAPNPRCSSLLFDTIQSQITPLNVNNSINFHLHLKNYPMEKFFSEIRLLMTMAIHHPAFNYEQQDLLMKQMEDLEAVIQHFEREQQIRRLQEVAHQQHNSNQPGTGNPYPGQAQQTAPSHTQQSVSASGHTLYPAPPSYQTSTGPGKSQQQQHSMPPVPAGQPYPQVSFLATSHHHPHAPPPHPHHTVPMYAAGSGPNTLLTPMALLKVSQSPQSSSPSPTLSPASSTAGSTGTSTGGNPSTGGGKQTAVVPPPHPPSAPSTTQASSIPPLGAIKIEHPTAPLYGSTAPPSSAMIFVTQDPVAPSQISAFFPPQLVSTTRMEETPLKPHTVTCYNCGGMGHRGNECSTVCGDEAH